MVKWLAFGRAAPRPVERVAPAMPPAEASPLQDGAGADRNDALLAWLLDAMPLHAHRTNDAETAAWRLLDALAAAPALPARLLARAPAVVPQLMRLMRRDDASLDDMARRVSGDPVLTAEVLRLSRSAWHRAGDEPKDLGHAIALLGRDGLQRAIARTLVKPLFDAPPSSLSGRAAARLWEHSTDKAERCALLAGQHGLDAFEGYLAGLLHNTGWTVALRAIDLSLHLAPPFGASFAQRLGPLKDRLFAKAVAGWHVTPLLDRLCKEMLRGGLALARSPLGSALYAADRAATTARVDGL